MGVIAMTCTATGDSFLAVSQDISRAFNRYTFQLGANLHPNKKLQKLWNQYGGSGFDCSVVKLLDYEDGETNLKRKLDQLLESCMQSTPGADKL